VPSFFAKGLKNTLTGQPMKPSHTFAVAESKKYVVKNIPDYLDLDAYKVHFGQLKHTDVPQYKGFLLNFQNTTTAEDYLLKHLSKRNRKNLKQKQQQLLREHNIKTQWFFGAIDEDSYTQIFKAFYKLLEKRFNEKKMNNRYLKNWAALQTTTYAKIGDKKASLFVIYDHNTPISITLNFHLNDVVFSHIQSYDIAYSHYNMGDISMWHHVQWCIKKKIAIFDLSMGETYNKVKWSNHEYLFYHRMYYQTTSLLEQGWAKFQITKFKWLQLLRDKHIIGGRLSLETLRFKFK
tara:strand:- start:41644 stop:42519 length:876 start_codon:yes stop_codon:yes gene_type:complete